MGNLWAIDEGLNLGYDDAEDWNGLEAACSTLLAGQDPYSYFRGTISELPGIIRLGGVPREQKMLKGHLPRVIYHRVYQYTKTKYLIEKQRGGEDLGYDNVEDRKRLQAYIRYLWAISRSFMSIYGAFVGNSWAINYGAFMGH